MVVLLMGVSGAGKTTIGRALAARLGCPFFDADDLHAPAAIASMRAGIPLTDADRVPWLARVRALVEHEIAQRATAVLACSALTEPYRARLGLPRPEVVVICLDADDAVLRARLRARRDHFVQDQLLTSQRALLEVPAYGHRVDVAEPTPDVVARIVALLGD